jgi:NAD(P)H-flavin reductase
MNAKQNNELIEVKVVAVKGLNPTVKSVRFKITDEKVAKSFSFVPGQFLLVSVAGYGEAPLTFTTGVRDLPEFEVAVRSVGETTKAITRLKPGDIAYFRGPLGNGTPFEMVYGQDLYLIAGGIGLAPLRSVIKTIEYDDRLVGSLKIIYGAKDPESLIYKDELTKWPNFTDPFITVDKADGDWRGLTGVIPKIIFTLKFSPDSVVIICGPPAMTKPVVKILLEKGVKEERIHVMLERRVRCGIGKCQHCTCGDKYVCTDGPTLPWSEIKNNWELDK